MDDTISLVLIDANRLFREGLAALIRDQPGFKILAASADIDEVLQKVREARPQVVLLDFGLEDQDSLRVTTTIHREVPDARVVVMGMLAPQEDIADLVEAGAAGFVMKDASFEDFLGTIRHVATGGQVLPSALTGSLFGQIARRATQRGKGGLVAVRLTRREQQVVTLISEGLSNREIASRLHVAVYTVKTHVHNVLEKLALRSRLEVAAFSRTGDQNPNPPPPSVTEKD